MAKPIRRVAKVADNRKCLFHNMAASNIESGTVFLPSKVSVRADFCPLDVIFGMIRYNYLLHHLLIYLRFFRLFLYVFTSSIKIEVLKPGVCISFIYFLTTVHVVYTQNDPTMFIVTYSMLNKYSKYVM